MCSLHGEALRRLADVPAPKTTILQVNAHISVPLTTPDRLVTENGSKLPLWAVSDDDLRLLACAMADEMVAKAAKQRAAAMADQPLAPTAGQYIGLQRGSPPDRPGERFFVEDARAPGVNAGHPRKREEPSDGR